MSKIYCLQSKKCAENEDQTIFQTNNGRTMIAGHCRVSNSKKTFIKEKDAKRAVGK